MYEKFIISVKKKVFVLEANTKRQRITKTLLLNAFDWTLQSQYQRLIEISKTSRLGIKATIISVFQKVKNTKCKSDYKLT